MKKLIIVLGILFVSLVGIFIVMPMIFKEDAKKAVNMIASLTGLNDLVTEEVRMKIKIDGNYEDPQFRLDGISNIKKGSNGKKIKDWAKEQAKIKLKEQQELAGEKIKEELDNQKFKLKEEAAQKAKDLKEKTKKVISDEVKSKLGGKLKGLKKKDGL
tara:strand:+ start:28 stop:501 length:474 start_codon:yes stop_codon:yes gene_type:complete